MRYIILVISTVLALQLHPRHHIKEIWDEHPNLEGIFELDTLISGYWEVRIDDKRTLYPTMVGYLAQPDMKNYTGQPAMSSVMERSYYYFRFRIPDEIDGQYDVFYEDKYVRVFVGIKQLARCRPDDCGSAIWSISHFLYMKDSFLHSSKMASRRT